MKLNMAAQACMDYVEYMLAGKNYFQNKVNLKLVRAVERQITKFLKRNLNESDVTQEEIVLQSKLITYKLKRGMITYDIAILFSDVFNSWYESIFKPNDFIQEAKCIKRQLRKIKVKLTLKKYYYVEFEQGGKLYVYDYDDFDIDIGDRVLVPKGEENLERRATVVEYAPLCLNDLDFTISSIKKIIKKVEET